MSCRDNSCRWRARFAVMGECCTGDGGAGAIDVLKDGRQNVEESVDGKSGLSKDAAGLMETQSTGR